MPIGAAQTASGYDVAWEIPGANEYTVWSTDSNGNYLSDLIPTVSGNSTALEALETTFHQDLNGDGTIGIPTVVIQTAGSTAQTEVGTNFFLYDAGTGPELKDGGAAVTAGQFGSSVPIGAVQDRASGYMSVAWETPGANEYTVVEHRQQRQLSLQISSPPCRGTAPRWKRWRPHLPPGPQRRWHDRYSDGGHPDRGSTSLTEVGNNFFLYDAGSGPELKDGGAAVTASEFGSSVPIGAVQTASGYDVAWETPGANEYTVWSTDSSGNAISRRSSSPPCRETAPRAGSAGDHTFHQDLNGDGTIGIPTVVIETDEVDRPDGGRKQFLHLYDAGSGPELKDGGAAVTAGEFGSARCRSAYGADRQRL